jgi:hypothetical protein
MLLFYAAKAKIPYLLCDGIYYPNMLYSMVYAGGGYIIYHDFDNVEGEYPLYHCEAIVRSSTE